ncbi:MAG: hypothetical protein Q8J64_02270, partial [Thermodesulfovibrionales bacterium]|nr:hypothetical protein [Thermodesulfovibrionales bacterium]
IKQGGCKVQQEKDWIPHQVRNDGEGKGEALCGAASAFVLTKTPLKCYKNKLPNIFYLKGVDDETGRFCQ